MRMRDKIGIVLILVAGVFSIMFSADAAAETDKGVTVKDLSGIVDVKKAGTDVWVPAGKGMKLTSGDAIKTTIDSAVDLAFENGSVIRLNEETTLGVEDLSENVEKARFLYVFDRNVKSKKTKFKLDEGSIMASVTEVGNSRSQFTVQTPKGIAGVRGTNWEVGQKALAVTSGFIDWVPKNQLNSDGAGLPFIAEVRRLIGGTMGRTMGGYNFTRINEGARATLDRNGNIESWSVIGDQMARQINNFVRTNVGQEATLTHVQADSNRQFDREYLGDAGIGGTVSSGQAAGNLQGQEAASFAEASGTTTTSVVGPRIVGYDHHGNPIYE